MRCTRLAQKAAASVEKLRGKTAVVDLNCAVLGLPKSSPLPPDGAEHVAGAVVALRKPNGLRQDYLLVACVSGDQWLCHKGSGEDGKLDEDGPFKAS